MITGNKTILENYCLTFLQGWEQPCGILLKRILQK